MDYSKFIQRQKVWSLKTFGEGERTEGILKHISTELAEVLRAPTNEEKLEECVDIIILASDMAWRLGFDPDDIEFKLLEKQIENMKRKWPDRSISEANQDKPTYHIKE